MLSSLENFWENPIDLKTYKEFTMLFSKNKNSISNLHIFAKLFYKMGILLSNSYLLHVTTLNKYVNSLSSLHCSCVHL